MQTIDEWERIQLGKGAFGVVTLFKNTQTDEHLVVKEAHDENMTERMKERWKLECLKMTQLNHPNIVKGLQLPGSLRHINEGVSPVLTMEFCNMEDLRRKISKSINMYGLEEYQVKMIAHDVTEAVVYLHANRIFHRDLKPENIVLDRRPGGRVVYKVTDLGYAKEISDTSSCYSMVGTLQYLAPELLLDKSYDGKVDYWSLATTLFECSTGFRPFAPTAYKDNLKEVIRRKQDIDIYVIQEGSAICFYQTLPKPTRLTLDTKRLMESWFGLMLRFDPVYRGGHFADGTFECFNLLNEILHLKILTVYKPQTMESQSYDVSKDDGSLLADRLINMHEDGDYEYSFLISQEGKEVGGAYRLENKAFRLDYALEYTNLHESCALYQFSCKEGVRPKKRPLNALLHALKTDKLEQQKSFQQQLKCSKVLTYHSYEQLKEFSRLSAAVQALSVYMEGEKGRLKGLRGEKDGLCALKDFIITGLQLDIGFVNRIADSDTAVTAGAAVDGVLKQLQEKSCLVEEDKIFEALQSTLEKLAGLKRHVCNILSEDAFHRKHYVINQHYQDAIKIETGLRKTPHDMIDKVNVTKDLKCCLVEGDNDYEVLVEEYCDVMGKIIQFRNLTKKISVIIETTTNDYRSWQNASRNLIFSLYSSTPHMIRVLNGDRSSYNNNENNNNNNNKDNNNNNKDNNNNLFWDSTTQELCMESMQLIRNVEKMLEEDPVGDIDA